MAHQFSVGDPVQCIDTKLCRLKLDTDYIVKSTFINRDNGSQLLNIEPPPEYASNWPDGMGPFAARRFIPAEKEYDPTQMGDQEDDI